MCADTNKDIYPFSDYCANKYRNFDNDIYKDTHAYAIIDTKSFAIADDDAKSIAFTHANTDVFQNGKSKPESFKNSYAITVADIHLYIFKNAKSQSVSKPVKDTNSNTFKDSYSYTFAITISIPDAIKNSYNNIYKNLYSKPFTQRFKDANAHIYEDTYPKSVSF